MGSAFAKRCLGAALVFSLSGCSVLSQGFLNAQGPVADHERHLFAIVCIILLFVAAPVLILTPLFAWYFRLTKKKRRYEPNWTFSWPLEGLVWLPPIGIVILLGFLMWPSTKQDDPYTRVAAPGAPVRVQAIGLDWKWVFVYPDLGIATVNELAVPVGRPVNVELTSGTVMQSMLIPQLAGQIYAMAGMRTKLSFAAARPGTYLGKNTQFNGSGFPKERFNVVALPDGGYDAWVARVRATPAALDAATWSKVSQRSAQMQPLFFGRVMPDLFSRVVAASGGHSQPSSHSMMASR